MGKRRFGSKIKVAYRVPTLAIYATGDPFQPGDSIPKDGADRSSNLAILATKYGAIWVSWRVGCLMATANQVQSPLDQEL